MLCLFAPSVDATADRASLAHLLGFDAGLCDNNTMDLTGVDWLYALAIWAVILAGILAVTFIASLLFWARYPKSGGGGEGWRFHQAISPHSATKVFLLPSGRQRARQLNQWRPPRHPVGKRGAEVAAKPRFQFGRSDDAGRSSRPNDALTHKTGLVTRKQI